MMMRIFYVVGVIVCSLIMASCISGCGGDARLEMTSAEAINGVADQLAVVAAEYHKEVVAADDDREDDVTSAFIERILSDSKGGKEHAVAFRAALKKIRADREVEVERYRAHGDNIDVLREISKGLNRLAVESLTLNDEAKRYLLNWMDTATKARAEVKAVKATAQSQTQTLINQAVDAAICRLGGNCAK